MPPILYDVVIEGDFTPERIDWGSDAGWADRLRDKLDSASRLCLIPKQGAPPGLPIANVELGDGRRWILFMRVYRRVNSPVALRVYCLGWQTTIKGKNFKTLLWVYPNGMVEMSEEPMFYKEIMGHLARYHNERVDEG